MSLLPHDRDRVLPPALLSLIEKVEKFSISVPLWRSVLVICAAGLLGTSLLTWWVWQLHLRQDRHDFVTVSRLLQLQLKQPGAATSPGGYQLQGWHLIVNDGRALQVLQQWDDASVAYRLNDQGLVWSLPQPSSGTEATLTDKPLITGQQQWLGWSRWLEHYLGVWLSALSGLLVTFAGLYAYVLIIATRTRAQRIAKQTTQAILRSESRSKAVVDTAPDAILTVSDEGQILWCNQATLSIFGQSLEELTGQPLGVVIPDLMGMSLVKWFDTQGIAGRIIGFETFGCRVEGTRFPISVSARRAALDDEAINTIIVRDTTDAKWAEQELLLRERALASSAEGIIITDMNLPGQPTIYVNAAFERITGYGLNDILGQNCRILQKDDEDQPGIREMRQAIALGQACQVVVRNYRKDGGLFWNELTISPVFGADQRVTHYVGVSSDITKRKAAEQLLHQRNERLNAVFDLSPDGFVVLDASDEVSIVNPAFERMSGLKASDLVGQSREAFESQLKALCASIELEDAPRSARAGGMVDETLGLPASQRELWHLKAPLNKTLARRIRHDEAQSETVMYFRDITQELMIDRMKSEFLSMAAHELRTPLASIYGFTELLLHRQFDEHRRADMLATIHRQAHVLINLINELLDIARIEARRGKDFKKQQQLLQPLIETTVAGLLMHGDDRKVEMRLPQQPIELQVDAEKLGQAITNVLSNAYKYSPNGGAIRLDVICRTKPGHRECGIRVEDEGIGMSAEHLSRLFERFFRADTSGNIPGTGLGMTIVKEIIELHGGEVQVDSALGRGTTVTLWLPMADHMADADVPAH